MSKFQLIVLILFGFFIGAGLIGFALFRGSKSEVGPTVVIWGTIDQRTMGSYIETALKAADSKAKIQYVQKSPATFHAQFVEALAVGAGPDVILVSQDNLLRQQNKIFPIPYQSYSERQFKDTFIPESELYLDSTGILSVPLAVDPLVMYWNKNLFTNAGIGAPPRYWEEFLPLVKTLTQRDQAYNITQSAVAMGDFTNIVHAKEILNLLIMQSGNPIVARTTVGLQSTLKQTASVDAALTFFTQFANPVKDVYTWNRALPSSKDLFIANKLGMYFGYASEYREIAEKNPNLNFDVATMPQIKPQPGTNPVKMTFGKMYGFAIVRSTPDVANTLSAIYLLTSKAAQDQWPALSGLPSIRLDSLTPDPAFAPSAVFTTSALWARGWLDPNGETTNQIFKDLVDGVVSGRLRQQEAISQAHLQLDNLFTR